MDSKKITIMIAEDDVDFIYLIKQLIATDLSLAFGGCATTKDAAVKLAYELRPDIVLMDLNLSSNTLDGIEASKQIRIMTDAKVILLTSFESFDTVIEASIKSFACGYVFKSQYETLIDCIKNTALGHTPQELLIESLILSQLTSAEKAVLKKILGKDIQLLSSDKTIANQKTNIFKKLGVKNQKEISHILNHLNL